MCLDEQWVIWLKAYLAGEDPELTAVGFAYMLQGGSDTNNADPTLTEPPAGGEWVHLSTTRDGFVTRAVGSISVLNRSSRRGSLGDVWRNSLRAHYVPVNRPD